MNLSEYKTPSYNHVDLERPTRIVYLTQRVEGIIDMIKDMDVQLEKKILQILGEYPKEQNVAGQSVPPAATLGQLEAKIDAMTFCLSNLQDKINRIQEL